MKQIIVVGAGASGLTAAAAAANEGAKVCILDGMRKPGRKLLLTGNGRCNLTNMDCRIEEVYYSKTKEMADAFVRTVFRRFSRDDTLAFFREIGLYVQERNGYVYPKSGQAQTVLKKLLAELNRLHVTVRYDSKVRKIFFNEKKQRWIVSVGDWDYEADAVVLCTGSKVMPVTGSDGSGYQMAAELGHTVRKPLPALTALSCKDPALKLCAGARTKARIELVEERTGIVLGCEEGEVQWTAAEISGIPVFQLSRFVHGVTGKAVLRIDFLPEYSEIEVRNILTEMLEHNAGMENLPDLLSGLVNERIAAFLAEKSGLDDRRMSLEKVSDAAGLFAGLLKKTELPVDGTRGYEHAQVCTGGIDLEEINPGTMESRLYRGLYFAGEIVDIDGPCGGYNLQWAWSSGAAAGKAAAENI